MKYEMIITKNCAYLLSIHKKNAVTKPQDYLKIALMLPHVSLTLEMTCVTVIVCE